MKQKIAFQLSHTKLALKKQATLQSHTQLVAAKHRQDQPGEPIHQARFILDDVNKVASSDYCTQAQDSATKDCLQVSVSMHLML